MFLNKKPVENNRMLDFIDSIEKEKKHNDYLTKIKCNPEIKIKKLNVSLNKSKEDILSSLLCKLYKDSLPLDDEYKEANDYAFKNDVVDFMNKKGGSIFYIKEAIKKTKSPRLIKMLEACERVAKDEYNKKALSISDLSEEDLDYRPNADTENSIMNIAKDMEFDEISEIIKNNVKQTVLNEIEKTKKEEEERELLNNELSQNDEVTSESAIEKAIQLKYPKREKIYQPSLFEAILMSNYKLVHESGYSFMMTADDALAKTIREYTLLTLSKTLMLESYSLPTLKKMANDYLKK